MTVLQVFFRRGISSSIGNTNEENAKGKKWVEMVGSFALLSMALNDQVMTAWIIFGTVVLHLKDKL